MLSLSWILECLFLTCMWDSPCFRWCPGAEDVKACEVPHPHFALCSQHQYLQLGKRKISLWPTFSSLLAVHPVGIVCLFNSTETCMHLGVLVRLCECSFGGQCDGSAGDALPQNLKPAVHMVEGEKQLLIVVLWLHTHPEVCYILEFTGKCLMRVARVIWCWAGGKGRKVQSLKRVRKGG